MTDATTDGKVQREARLRWHSLADMKVNPLAQREINQARVDRLVAHLDLEQVGTPTVNVRGGSVYVIDGQHRVEAMRQFGFTDEKIQCWTYEGLSEQEEAEKFLQLNDVLVVASLPKFRAAVHAGRDAESDIDRVVRSLGLVVTKDKVPGAIGAVGTLGRVYGRSGPGVLSRSLRIIRDAYGDAGLEAPVIDGLGLLCQRMNGELDEDSAVQRLKAAHGGAEGLLGAAEKMRRQTGQPKGQCVAAAAIDIINRGRGGKKLPSWWKED